MTEKTSKDGAWARAATAVSLGSIAGLAGYIFELGRAGSYTTHFGVAFSSADPRQAVIPLGGIGLVVVIVVGTVLLSGAAELTFTRVAVVILGSILLRPLSGDLRSGIVTLGLVMVVALCSRVLWRTLRQHVKDTWVDRVKGDVARVRGVVARPAYVFVFALVAVWGAWPLGSFEGRLQAQRTTDFDVSSRDATSATVIFTRTGEIVSRVLDVSPGPDGKPRNIWRPGVTIRPMPDGGISYERIRLGRTHRSEVTAP